MQGNDDFWDFYHLGENSHENAPKNAIVWKSKCQAGKVVADKFQFWRVQSNSHKEK